MRGCYGAVLDDRNLTGFGWTTQGWAGGPENGILVPRQERRGMAFPFFLAAAIMLAGCATTRADGGPRLAEAEKGAVLQAAAAVLAAGSCRNATAEIADAPIRLDDPRLGGAVWQTVRVEGCGRRARLNMLVAPASGGAAAASVTPLLPGATAADPLLQREGLRLVLLAVRDAAPGCERIAVNDTRADAGAAPAHQRGAAARRPWAEVWSLSACGRALAVAVRFAPGREGTEIIVEPGAARLLP